LSDERRYYGWCPMPSLTRFNPAAALLGTSL